MNTPLTTINGDTLSLSRRSLTTALPLAILIALALFLLAATPAHASRPYLSQITAGNAPFVNPHALAVDKSDNLWVDEPSHSLDKFNSAGALLAEAGTGTYVRSITFANATNLLIVGEAGPPYYIEFINADGTINSRLGNYLGIGFENLFDVAADNSSGPGAGTIYLTGRHEVGNKSIDNAVFRINSAGNGVAFSFSDPSYVEGAEIFGTPAGPFTNILGEAVGPTGLLFVSDAGKIDEFEPSGKFIRTFNHVNSGEPLGTPTAIAIDPTSGNVLVVDTADDFVDEFSPTGEFLEEYTEANGVPFGDLNGIAVDSTGRLYVSDGANGQRAVDVFGPAGAPAPKLQVKVEKIGFGRGLVTSRPPGISCGTKCLHAFNQGATITLTATPRPGNEVKGWTGCDSEPSATECEVEVTSAKTVQAEFSLAPASRQFDAQLTGQTPPDAAVPGPFQSASALAIDADENVWVGDEGNQGVITEYDPLGGFLSQQTGAGHWQPGQSVPRAIAINQASGSLYVVNSPKEELDLFDLAGSFLEALSTELQGDIKLAIDNTGGASQGRYYVMSNGLRAFESNGQEHEFSASGQPGKEYIQGAKIIGTPSGPFGSSFGPTAVGPAGEIFVYDNAHRRLDEFDPTGTFVREITSAGVPGGLTSEVQGIAVDPTNGDVLLDGRINVATGSGEPSETASVIWEFSAAGGYLGEIAGPGPGTSFNGASTLAVNSQGYLYVIDGRNVVDVFLPRGELLPTLHAGAASSIERTSATLTGEAGPGAAGEEINQCRFDYVAAADFKPWEDNPFGSGPSAGTGPCLNGAGEVIGTLANPITAPTAVHADISSLIAQSTYHWRISATGTNANGTPANALGTDFQTPPAVQDVETRPATEISNLSATLNGAFTGEQSVDAHFYFEYGTTTKYGHQSPAPPGTDHPGAGAQQLSTEVTELVPNTTYHFRVVIVNEFGTTFGGDQTFTTDTKPTVNAFSSSNVTADSADLHAQIDPEGFATTYRFEYGSNTDYGQSIPIPDGEIATGLSEVHSVVVHLSGLQPATYHFRVTAQSKWGSATTEDQTFEFFPSNCPNNVVRQQTGASYLPDCRAYELVSPPDANGTLFFPGGPATGQATDPARLSFTGLYSAPAGANVIDTAGDLYVASRTNTGWHTKYVGLSGNEAGCVGGPPNLESSRVVAWTSPQSLTNTIATDPSMSNFMLWRDGTPVNCALGSLVIFFDATWPYAPPSNAPYMVGSDGDVAGRLPAGLSSDASKAFDCPYLDLGDSRGHCTGDVMPSGDLHHLAFSSRTFEFAPGGATSAPGSAYDMDVSTGTTTLISKLPSGAAIPQDPAMVNVPLYVFGGHVIHPGGAEEFIRFPAVSTDGTHILMSTATEPTPECQKYENPTTCPRFTDTPVHLYMSIDDAATLEIAGGSAVNYVGMTPDGSEVYLTSSEQLTPDDVDHSVDLYAWSAATDSLTLLSAGDDEGNPGEPGSSDECEAALRNENSPWTPKCDVAPYSGYAFSVVPGYGGNGISDTPLATKNGDIYFYSPELLDGDRGVVGKQNLYDYREGRPHFVASFSPERYCVNTGFFAAAHICAEGPIARLNVASDDSHAAFTTTEQLTSYHNAGHLEMYLYTPASAAIVCVSCRPDGEAPSSDVQASSDGLFMTDDGRTFFSTTEALVPRDTNRALDTYEYVDGRPQLISPGTGTAPPPHEGEGKGNPTAIAEVPGLIGVSANGTDAYFATYDGLVPEDHNGGFYRFYDARTGGGFAQPTPEQPCSAAEECHGPGTEPPVLPAQATAAELTGGNLTRPRHHGKRHHKQAKHKRQVHRAAHKHGDHK